MSDALQFVGLVCWQGPGTWYVSCELPASRSCCTCKFQGEVPCWEEAAELLSDYGFQVALPDLHATPQTSPVALSTADAVKFVAECADALQVRCCALQEHQRTLLIPAVALQVLACLHTSLALLMHVDACAGATS